MRKYHLCIWMNIPSHHQAAFFSALNARDDVDLQVRYLEEVPLGRVAEGWNEDFHFESYEQYVGDISGVPDKLGTLHNWDERIHIISSNFNPDLVDYFCTHKVRWCHWSEMPGIRLAELISYRTRIYRLLNPLMIRMKRKQGLRIRQYALGAFGQGALALKAFMRMGIPPNKIADLFYAPEALKKVLPCAEILQFAGGRKVFLVVGALCRRKGIDLVLKAFAALNANSWCLVLCGFDKADGIYQSLAKKLAIEDRVLFLGAYPSEQIAAVYTAADVFILASRFDGWGAALNEAASLGLPLIGTDLCGASWHVIQGDRNGYRVTAGHVTSLTAAMKTYVTDPALINKHGEESSAVFAEELTPDINAERLVNALKKWGAE